MKPKIDPLVVEYIQTKDDKLKEKIVIKYKSLIEYIARKLAFNKDDVDDLIQIGNIAILKALDRFSLDKNADFGTFATPNIIGEIKHYFRDKSRLVKIPRKLQELNSKIKTALQENQEKNKNITVKELSEMLNEDEEKILEAMEAGNNLYVLSLDAPSYKNDFFKQETSILDKISAEHNEDNYLTKETLKQALKKVTPRERRILYLRFYGGLSQSEIATHMGLSQMHISRILAKSIQTLRKRFKALDY